MIGGVGGKLHSQVATVGKEQDGGTLSVPHAALGAKRNNGDEDDDEFLLIINCCLLLSL